MAEMTGRKVLAITVGAFGVIIAVNLLMAFKAISTFPGLEVQNSYVASQTFDAERTAQQALGWSLAAEYDQAGRELVLRFTDAAGRPAAVHELDVLVGRTTEAREDRRPEFTRADGAFRAPLDLARGKWMLKIEAASAPGTPFRQRLELFVQG
ncbi:nitrogen fixation protein FixH [Cereibacter ovatus]|uniref:Nitrogen fixation protein FixH n=1 Tax=Cereibacter ovatus TaxID=439529 RepID=A0A285CME9_9RHOB|nr:FixH family protein [Cereibacter ovatus]SNX68739.1 nitrogen fixation protein FixH [Cereibacter ovatus]